MRTAVKSGLGYALVSSSSCEEKSQIVTIITICTYVVYILVGFFGFCYLRRRAIYRREQVKQNAMNSERSAH